MDFRLKMIGILVRHIVTFSFSVFILEFILNLVKSLVLKCIRHCWLFVSQFAINKPKYFKTNNQDTLVTYIKSDDSKCLQMWLKRSNKDINDIKTNLHPPWLLHWCCKEGKVNCVKVLLQAGANIDSQIRRHHSITSLFTPLMFAVLYQQKEIVEILLKWNADLYTRDIWGFNVLHLSVQLEDGEDILHMILSCMKKRNQDSKVNCKLFNEPTLNGDTPLLTAILNFDAKKHCVLSYVDALIDNGANPSLPGLHDQLTPITSAITINVTNSLLQMELIELLLRKGADIDGLGSSQSGNLRLSPPILHAVAARNFSLVSFLLEMGANPDIPGASNHTPLSLSAEVGCIPISLTLLNYKCCLCSSHCSSQLSRHKDPMKLALRRGHWTIVKLLLMAGYDVSRVKLLMKERLSSKLEQSPVMASWLKLYTNVPQSLKHFCRKAVRKCLRPPLYVSVSQMTIPTAVQDYILCYYDGELDVLCRLR